MYSGLKYLFPVFKECILVNFHSVRGGHSPEPPVYIHAHRRVMVRSLPALGAANSVPNKCPVSPHLCLIQLHKLPSLSFAFSPFLLLVPATLFWAVETNIDWRVYSLGFCVTLVEWGSETWGYHKSSCGLSAWCFSRDTIDQWAAWKKKTISKMNFSVMICVCVGGGLVRNQPTPQTPICVSIRDVSCGSNAADVPQPGQQLLTLCLKHLMGQRQEVGGRQRVCGGVRILCNRLLNLGLCEGSTKLMQNAQWTRSPHSDDFIKLQEKEKSLTLKWTTS